MGGVDILVNNAGIPKRRKITALDAETAGTVMNVNYLAAVRLTLALLPPMIDRREGRIINVSSIAATLSSPGEAAYDASKAALTAFSEAMAVELWETGVKVLVVYPGLVDTELFSLPDNDPVPENPVTPIPVAELVAEVFSALERDASQVYVPAWFGDVAADKARDLEAYLSGSAAFFAQQRSASG
jgi:short-subunit dehydrogenase